MEGAGNKSGATLNRGESHLPPGDYEIAWRYLLPGAHLTRTVEDVEIFNLSRAQKTIEVDVCLPGGRLEGLWYLPLAFLSKQPIAPDLEVLDRARDQISIPTKRECMALTEAAIARISDENLVDCTKPDMTGLIWEAISYEPFESYVARSIAEDRMSPSEDLLRSILRPLEDRYILWIPIAGKAASAHKISISRRQPLERDPILPSSIRRVTEVVDTAAGLAQASFEAPTGPRYPSLFEIAERTMQAFGLAPLVHGLEVPDARRASSFHVRVRAPDGFVVRDIELDVGEDERLADSLAGLPSPEDHPDITLQGHESEVAHLHCARDKNHESLIVYTIFGIQDGLMTLWAGAVVFTAVLLWGLQRAAPYPVVGGELGSLELSGAVLLVGPALASAWAIRADTGEVLERFLIGARTVLLFSATLSVLATLSLAGIRPAGWGYSKTIELYAGLGYAAAIPISLAWIVSQRYTWFLYRHVLRTSVKSLLSVAGIAAVCVLVAFHDNPGDRSLGVFLLALGLAYAVVGSNRAGMESVRVRIYPFFALFGCVTALAIAGYYLDLYARHFDAPSVHLALLLSQVALALSAVAGACVRLWRN